MLYIGGKIFVVGIDTVRVIKKKQSGSNFLKFWSFFWVKSRQKGYTEQKQIWLGTGAYSIATQIENIG